VERRGDMKVTLSKLILAKRKLDGPATDGLLSRVFSPMGGSIEEEIRMAWKNGGGR
jgi:hypothetical protein